MNNINHIVRYAQEEQNLLVAYAILVVFLARYVLKLYSSEDTDEESIKDPFNYTLH
jgi:hypothetical protein